MMHVVKVLKPLNNLKKLKIKIVINQQQVKNPGIVKDNLKKYTHIIFLSLYNAFTAIT